MTEQGIIDVDCWAVKVSIEHLAPYLSSSRRAWLRIDEDASSAALPESKYFLADESLTRPMQTDDAVARRRADLDERRIARALLNHGAATSMCGFASPGFSSEMSRAVNEWTAAEWLGKDPRFLGSIVVSSRDPVGAAEEIRRCADNPGMAQVLLAYPQQLLGHRMHRPIFEAACECDLPVSLQAGGEYSGPNPGLTGAGHPESHLEARLGPAFAAQPHLASMITQGVFDRFSTLKIVFNGFGIAWLPSLLWRMTHEYRSGTVDPRPALERTPEEYLRDNVRFTTAALEVPDDPSHLEQLLALVRGENLLMYGSGPFGMKDVWGVVSGMSRESRRRIMTDNANEFLGLSRVDAAAPV